MHNLKGLEGWDIPAKALSFPVITMAPVFLSSSNWRRALFNSANRAEDRAFHALGLFRVTCQSQTISDKGPK